MNMLQQGLDKAKQIGPALTRLDQQLAAVGLALQVGLKQPSLLGAINDLGRVNLNPWIGPEVADTLKRLEANCQKADKALKGTISLGRSAWK